MIHLPTLYAPCNFLECSNVPQSNGAKVMLKLNVFAGLMKCLIAQYCVQFVLIILLINSCNSNLVSCSVTNSIQIMKRDSITFFNQSFSLLLSLHLVYPQSLVVNSAARRTCTVGEIVNLVSADTQKLMDFVVYFNAVWLAPIEVTLCLFFLWQVR